MTLKANDMYQGDDWLTYRSTVAQAFDTLDRLREICEEHTLDEMRPHSDKISSLVHVIEEEMALMMGVIAGLCDDLAAELDAVLAELFPSLRQNVSYRWIGFEMQFHLRALRQDVAKAQASMSPSLAVLDEILTHIDPISDRLKFLDQ